MRHSWLVLAGLLLAPAIVFGQQQQQPAEAPPALDPQNRLDALLMQWEAKMKGVQSIYAKVERLKINKVFQTNEVFVGEAKYMKPNLALLNLQIKNGNKFERFVCTGTFLYQYDPDNKQILVNEMPAPKPGQVADDNFLSFVFGMRAVEAKRRYDITLYKEDTYYHFLKILPRFPADKADFQTAYLALTRNTLLPRTLVFDEPTGSRVQWDIPVIDAGARLDRREFEKPQLPPGWKFATAPKAPETSSTDPKPRVVRPTKP